MDEVLADALGEHIRLYNRDFGTRVTKADLQNNWLSDVVPEERRAEAFRLVIPTGVSA